MLVKPPAAAPLLFDSRSDLGLSRNAVSRRETRVLAAWRFAPTSSGLGAVLV